MSYIRLTPYQTNRVVYINSDKVTSVEPERDGCVVTTDNGPIFKVEESHKQVLKLLEGAKTKGKPHGQTYIQD